MAPSESTTFNDEAVSASRFEKRQAAMRQKLIDLERRRVLVSVLHSSRQSGDEYTELNCDGVGRVRSYTSFSLHFDQSQRPGRNAAYRGVYLDDGELRSQVFQVAGCDLRCWYCYVDFELLSGNAKRGRWLSVDELYDLAFAEPDRPKIIELSGGQVELVPEWILWFMQGLESRGERGEVRIWSDDNLTTDYFWRYLSADERSYIVNYPGYTRSVCLKGYDELSFSRNTGADGFLFSRQLEILEALIAEGMNLSVYLTMLDVVRPQEEVEYYMRKLRCQLEGIRPGLSAEVIPLRMASFANTLARATFDRLKMFGVQRHRFETWREIASAV